MVVSACSHPRFYPESKKQFSKKGIYFMSSQQIGCCDLVFQPGATKLKSLSLTATMGQDVAS
jgi:hypothetical protein